MTTVAVADDDATRRGELAAALREVPGVTVTTVCRTDDEAALAEVELAAPDVLLLGSVSAPPQDAWALARRFTGPRPVISVAGYGGFPSPGPLVHTLHGLFPAAASPAYIARCVPALAARAGYRDMRTRDELSRLTRRELSVLELLGRGLANREIARSLGLRPTTVKDHIRAVYTKCGVQNRVEAALLAHGIPVPPLPDGPVPRGSEAPPAAPCLC